MISNIENKTRQPGAGETLRIFTNGSSATRPRITAVVPAYNEATRIGAVIRVLCQVERLSEIVVVDDCSDDGTAEDAVHASGGDCRLHILQLPYNHGKGGAVLAGWEYTRAPFMLMLDADLINLKPAHVEVLMRPVLSGSIDMSVGLFQGGYWRTDLSHRVTPWLSGQRCLRTRLLSHVSRKAAAGYGLETALTVAARQCSWRLKYIPLEGVRHPLGENPRGGYHGWRHKLIMYAQIVRAWQVSRAEAPRKPRT